jgi:hypothetical protein
VNKPAIIKGQTISLDQVLHPTFTDLTLNLILMVQVLADGIMHPGRTQVWVAL